ncbi:hypothetical protein HK100_002692 [Physocladia obscura]|uniref:Uncharacterized protein n=1 Tax=Physocladia obscura TaxID=109957 RepID=A0AAD5XE26_9FUNG|nr:hypothetical protein HK100_002692 [Physocladia obscura]
MGDTPNRRLDPSSVYLRNLKKNIKSPSVKQLPPGGLQALRCWVKQLLPPGGLQALRCWVKQLLPLGGFQALRCWVKQLLPPGGLQALRCWVKQLLPSGGLQAFCCLGRLIVKMDVELEKIGRFLLFD